MAIGDVYKFELIGTHLGQQTINVFHYVRDGVSGAPDPDDFADAFMAMFSPDVNSLLSNQALFNTLHIQDVNISGFDFVRNGLAEHGGLSSTDDLPPFCAFGFLMQRTNRNTFHGHKRFGGVPESLQDDGVANGTAITLAATAGAALKSPITASGLDYLPCIYSTILNGVPR